MSSICSWVSARTVLALGGAVMGLALAAAGCSSSAAEETTATVAPCADIAIDRFKELEIVDEGVVTDARASNALDGSWSFRHVMEELTPAGMTTSDFTLRWLDGWRRESRVNSFPVIGRPRTSNVVTCPWLRRTPANQCNEDCSACTARELDLASAPFRLIALANRIDLRETEGIPEARLVYALTSGAADDPASQPLFMTLIAEYDVVGVSSKEWAERWHALGSHATFDEPYRADLDALFRHVVPRGAPSARGNGSALSQMRTNEREFDWQWDFRQFEITPAGLTQVGTSNTPDRSLNGTPALRSWILANKDAIVLDKHALPESFTGGVVTPAKWSVPQLDEQLRKAFARATCDGCHQHEAATLDVNFQISPFKKGPAKLSAFLNDVASPKTDDLSKKEASMQRALCGL